MNKHVKQVISYSELMTKINNILADCTECYNIHIDGIEVYQEQNDGANWDITRYRQSGSDHDLQECRSKIFDEICSLRVNFDVAEKS